MFNLAVPWWELVVRSSAVYLVLLFGLRIFGKREVGQFTLYDLVLVLLVANAVQPAMTGPDSSLLGGLIIIGTLIGLNAIVARLDHMPFFHRILTSPPKILIQDGAYIKEALEKEGVDVEECEQAIREHGLSEVKEVKLGVLESDGTISIVAKEGGSGRPKRRVRYRRR